MSASEHMARSDCGSGEGCGSCQSHTHIDAVKPCLTWKSPLETVINSNTINGANKNSRERSKGSRNGSKSKHHRHSGDRSKPKSKSDSHRCHHRRLSPTFKKKYLSVNFSMSPVASSPTCRSFGKMWIRPVPIPQNVNGHVCQNGKRVIPNYPPQLPLFPCFDSNQVACAQDVGMLEAVVENHRRQVSNDSSSGRCSPLRTTATSPPNLGIDGTSCAYPFLYSYPHLSSNEQGHRHVRSRHIPYLDPVSTQSMAHVPIAFGESGKPITAFKHSNKTFPLCPESVLRSGVSLSPTTVITNTWHHG